MTKVLSDHKYLLAIFTFLPTTQLYFCEFVTKQYFSKMFLASRKVYIEKLKTPCMEILFAAPT